MEKLKSVKLKWLQGQLGHVAYELTRVQYSSFAPQRTWTPAVNAYLCEGAIRICVELAGVGTSEIHLTLSEHRLLIHGVRQAPEPEGTAGCTEQILAMEIDYGPFERVIELPAAVQVNLNETRAEQHNGLLWITAPVKARRKKSGPSASEA